MTEIALLPDAVTAALHLLPAVRQIYPTDPASLLHELTAPLAHPLSSIVSTTEDDGRIHVEATIGLTAQRPAGPAALEAIGAIRAALADSAPTDVTVRLRIASID